MSSQWVYAFGPCLRMLGRVYGNVSYFILIKKFTPTAATALKQIVVTSNDKKSAKREICSAMKEPNTMAVACDPSAGDCRTMGESSGWKYAEWGCVGFHVALSPENEAPRWRQLLMSRLSSDNAKKKFIHSSRSSETMENGKSLTWRAQHSCYKNRILTFSGKIALKKMGVTSLKKDEICIHSEDIEYSF